MPILSLTGGKTVNVNIKKAEWILQQKNDPDADQSSLVDVGRKDFVELRQIRRVDFQETPNEDDAHWKERMADHAELVKAQDAERELWRKDSPDVKAKRMIRTGCLILFKARFNKSKQIVGEVYDQLMIALIEFFEKNPTEWWAEGKEYQQFIPSNQPPIVSNVKGFPSFGEAAQEKFEI